MPAYGPSLFYGSPRLFPLKTEPYSAVYLIFVVLDARSGTADAPPAVSFLARPPVSVTPRGAATAASGPSGTL